MHIKSSSSKEAGTFYMAFYFKHFYIFYFSFQDARVLLPDSHTITPL